MTLKAYVDGAPASTELVIEGQSTRSETSSSVTPLFEGAVGRIPEDLLGMEVLTSGFSAGKKKPACILYTGE